MSAYWHARRLADRAIRKIDEHHTRREQDEMVCRCGRRWPVGEKHP